MEGAAREATGEPEAVEEVVMRAHKTLDKVERIVNPMDNSSRQATHVRIEGAGHTWGALAVGIALGAAIASCAWVAATLSNIQETMRNNEAFIQATYQQAPEIRERFEKIKAEQEAK